MPGGDFSPEGRRARFWLNPDDAGRPVRYRMDPEEVPEDSALVLNVHGSSFYRSVYDGDNLSKLAKALKEDPKAVSSLTLLQVISFKLSAKNIFDPNLFPRSSSTWSTPLPAPRSRPTSGSFR